MNEPKQRLPSASFQRVHDPRGLLARLLDRLLSGQEDAFALGLTRALIAGILFLSALFHLGSVGEYFSDESMINDRFAALAFPSRWSLFFYVRDPLAVRMIWAIGTLALGMWALGLFTSISGAIGMLLWVSMYGRNPLLYAYPDQFGLLLGMLLVIMPAGRGFSLDARLRGKGGTVPIWCRRILQLQLGILYTATGLEKTGDMWREQGTAIYFTLANPYNRHFETGPALALLQPYLLRPLTFAVLIWEVGFGAFVLYHWLRELAGGHFPAWLRLGLRSRGEAGAIRGSGIRPLAEVGWPIPDLRRLFLGFGVLMHLGIQLAVYVVFFSPLAIFAYTSFFSSEDLERIGRRIRRPLVRLGRLRRRAKAKRARARRASAKPKLVGPQDSGPVTLS